MARATREKAPALTGCKSLTGWEDVDPVLEVDQTPIGKTPRSCPATSTSASGTTSAKLYAETSGRRKMRGYGRVASRSTPPGRCDVCARAGMVTVEMNFLPDVKLPCDVCNGARFNSETLSVLWRDKSIGDVLAMDVDDAVDFFGAQRCRPSIIR